MVNSYESSLITQLRDIGVVTQKKGMPDIVITIGDKLYFIEIKGGKDRISDEQHKTLTLLKNHGLNVCICYSGSINEIYEFDPSGPRLAYEYCKAYYEGTYFKDEYATEQWFPIKVNFDGVVVKNTHERIQKMNEVLREERLKRA